jgi:hypothetical protein
MNFPYLLINIKITNMSRSRSYSNNEDKVVIRKVAMYPNNLQKAFREASIELNRPISSVSGRWYKKLKNSNVVFVTYGKKGTVNVNRKNVHQNTTDNTVIKTGLWKKILNLFKK